MSVKKAQSCVDKLQEAFRHFQIARNFRGLKQPKKVDSVRAQAFKDAEFQNNISASSRLLWLSLRSRSSFVTRGRCWPSSACIRIARRRPATKRFAPLGAGIQIKWPFSRQSTNFKKYSRFCPAPLRQIPIPDFSLWSTSPGFASMCAARRHSDTCWPGTQHRVARVPPPPVFSPT